MDYPCTKCKRPEKEVYYVNCREICEIYEQYEKEQENSNKCLACQMKQAIINNQKEKLEEMAVENDKLQQQVRYYKNLLYGDEWEGIK